MYAFIIIITISYRTVTVCLSVISYRTSFLNNDRTQNSNWNCNRNCTSTDKW